MNWGKSIVLAFVCFALFIATLVTVCMRQDISLVSKDYYKEELQYQEQIDRMANAERLAQKPVIVASEQGVSLSFDRMAEIEQGQLTLFCPANASADRTYVLQPSTETTRVLSASLPKGMYRARMTWSMQGREFYMEEVIHL